MKNVIKIFLLSSLLLLVFVLVWLEFPFIVPPLQYQLFTHRSGGYYSSIASGCNSVLNAHHVTSNDVVSWTSDATARYELKLPGDDRSLPSIIRRWNPDFVLVGTNYVVVAIPPERMGGFAIVWTQQGQQTDHWVLRAGDDELTTVYSVTNN
jgi:hypothetical protein